MSHYKWLIFLFVGLFPASAFSQDPVIELQEFSSGYQSPVDVKHCGDSRLFIVQQNGYIYISDSLGTKVSTPFLDIASKIVYSGERGLLGLAFHPDYFSNGYFFVYYTRANDGQLRISRFTADSLNANAADPNSEQIVIEIPHPSFQNHNGGCLQFGSDGYLYIATGDGGSGGDPNENAQNTKNNLGKMLRLDVDAAVPYAVPADNPFVDEPDIYNPEIWAYGLRNPWRFSFDKYSGDLWIADVGQNNWEEIDYMHLSGGGGQNYGWDCYEGTHNYEPANCDAAAILTYPVYEYQHSGGPNGDCSVTGGYVYRGAQYGNLFGKYLFVDYCSGKFRATSKNADGTFTTILAGDEVIAQDEFTFSSFGEDYLGELYVTSASNGQVYKVTDTACIPTAGILVNNSNLLSADTSACIGSQLLAITGAGLTYQWQLNGDDITGATSESYLAVESGTYTLLVMNPSGCQNISAPVEVGEATVPVIEGADSIYCIGQSADTLVGVPPGGAFSGNGMNADVFDPDIAGTGIHQILYTFENEFGCIESAQITIEVVTCTYTDHSTDASDQFLLFPVPSNGMVHILGNNLQDAVMEISIFTLSGKLLKKLNYHVLDQNGAGLNVQPLADGIYLLKIESGNATCFKKLIIRK